MSNHAANRAMRVAAFAALLSPTVYASPWCDALARSPPFAAMLCRGSVASLRVASTQWATALPAHLAERQASELLTVVITTSVTPRHPSTWCLETVLASFRRVASLPSCRLVIVADGCVVKEGMVKPRPRAGRVDEGMAARYGEYVERLHSLAARGTYGGSSDGDADVMLGAKSPLLGATIIRLARNHGFGRALEVGISHVTTPFVLVVQHDRFFERGFDLDAVLGAMRAEPHAIKYVIMPTKKIDPARYRKKIFGNELNCCLDIFTGARAVRTTTPRRHSEARLVPLMAWIDSTHLASTSHYRNFVFEQSVPNGARVRRVGRFIEDKLGQQQSTALRAALRASNEPGSAWQWTAQCSCVHRLYGTWILAVPVEDDGSAAEVEVVVEERARSGASQTDWTASVAIPCPSVVTHVDGRDPLVNRKLTAIGLVDEYAYGAGQQP